MSFLLKFVCCFLPWNTKGELIWGIFTDFLWQLILTTSVKLRNIIHANKFDDNVNEVQSYMEKILQNSPFVFHGTNNNLMHNNNDRIFIFGWTIS